MCTHKVFRFLLAAGYKVALCHSYVIIATWGMNASPLYTHHNKCYSTPFYMHQKGYKLCLAVDSKGYGSGKGTHVSVFVAIMKEEHDDQLKGKMVKWRENKGRHEVTFDFTRPTLSN